MNRNVRANPDEQPNGVEKAILTVQSFESLWFAGQQYLLGQKPVTVQGLFCELLRSSCWAAINKVEIHDAAPTVSIGGRRPSVICKNRRTSSWLKRTYPASRV